MPRKPGLKQLSVWIEDETLQKIEAEAERQGIPRTLAIENALREKLGMAPKEMDPRTPRKYIRERPKKKKV
jgi:hypothetical protein